MNEDNEIIRVKTEDGTEIEAKVISKKPASSQESLKIGDPIILYDNGNRVLDYIVDFDEYGDVVTKYHNIHYKQTVEKATPGEIRLHTKYRQKELETRARIAEKLFLENYSPTGSPRIHAQKAHKAAEEFLQASREEQLDDEA